MTQEQMKAIDSQTYKKGDFFIVTMPLKKKGYIIKSDIGNSVFVNSKLPRAERKTVIRTLIQKSKSNSILWEA